MGRERRERIFPEAKERGASCVRRTEATRDAGIRKIRPSRRVASKTSPCRVVSLKHDPLCPVASALPGEVFEGNAARPKVITGCSAGVSPLSAAQRH